MLQYINFNNKNSFQAYFNRESLLPECSFLPKGQNIQIDSLTTKDLYLDCKASGFIRLFHWQKPLQK